MYRNYERKLKRRGGEEITFSERLQQLWRELRRRPIFLPPSSLALGLRRGNLRIAPSLCLHLQVFAKISNRYFHYQFYLFWNSYFIGRLGFHPTLSDSAMALSAFPFTAKISIYTVSYRRYTILVQYFRILA